MANGTLVAAPVRFSAKRDGAAIAMEGVDLLLIDNARVAEVWLFSADTQAGLPATARARPTSTSATPPRGAGFAVAPAI